MIKYFKADSDGKEFFSLLRRGIIERRLISSPSHILNQENAEIVIKVPAIIVLKNKNL